MEKYNTYTNLELEEELERLKEEYNSKQAIVIENYQKMVELASKYGEAEDVLNTRTGKKKEG